MLLSFTILLFFLFIGNLITSLGFILPGNVTGMLLLCIALFTGLIKEERIEKAAEMLLENMAFFFIPAGVGLMVHGKLLAEYWLPLTGAVLFSYLAVLLTVGTIQRSLIKHRKGRKDASREGEFMKEFFTSPLFFILLSLILYKGTGFLYRKSGVPLFHPVLLTMGALILYLSLTGTAYTSYMKGGEMIHFLLGPSVVALALPLYRRLRELRREAPAILVSIFFGSIVGVLSATLPLLILGVPKRLIASLAAKSVTTPIAMAITERAGGLPSLSAAVVVLTGILGAVLGPPVLRLCGIAAGIPFGLAMGSSAHGIGTARALEEGELEGASSGLAIGINGIMTAILVPLLLPLLFRIFP